MDEMDGLIIPGGESTTMLKLLHYEKLFDDLAELAGASRCSGPAPAQSDGEGRDDPAQESLGLMDIVVERNAYGRQVDSRVVELDPDPESRSAGRRANWRPCSSGRPLSGGPGTGSRCWRSMRAIRC